MLIDLSSDDLLHLVKGTEPSSEKVEALVKTALGAYSGSYDRWTWNKHQLAKLSDDELLSLYCFVVDAQPLPGTAPLAEEPII